MKIKHVYCWSMSVDMFENRINSAIEELEKTNHNIIDIKFVSHGTKLHAMILYEMRVIE